MKIFHAGIALLAIGWPVAANANWQFTKWGMSEADVIKASGHIAKPITDGKAQAQNDEDASYKLEMPYTAGNFVFDLKFRFDARDKLDRVSLTLKQGNAIELIGQLNTKYGEPTSHSSSAFSESDVWRTDADQLVLIATAKSPAVSPPLYDANLEYFPRNNAINKGL